MNQNTRRYATHPARIQLRRAAWRERAALVRALGIEFDWIYHDGPEWAARYWQAFGDLEKTRAHDDNQRLWFACVARWHRQPACADSQAASMRTLFRHLLTCLHPEVTVVADNDGRTWLWQRACDAYSRGDRGEMERAARRADTSAYANGLRLPLPQLRREHERLCRVRKAVDRRLAGMADQFPYCLRHTIDDAEWIEHKRRAWRQALAVAAPQRLDGVTARSGVSSAGGKRVSLRPRLADSNSHDRYTAHSG